MWSVMLEINLCPDFLFLFFLFLLFPDDKKVKYWNFNFEFHDARYWARQCDGGLLTKFLTSMGKKMLYRIYTFLFVPRHLHEHSYASVSVQKSCFHMHKNIHMFVHIMQIAIRPLWLVFEKPLPERAPQMAWRMTQQMTRWICDWYARHLTRYSCECVNVTYSLLQFNSQLPTRAPVSPFNWSVSPFNWSVVS